MCRASIIGKLVTNPIIKYDNNDILCVTFTLEATEHVHKKSVINSYQIIVYGIDPKSIFPNAIENTKIMVTGITILSKSKKTSSQTEEVIMANPNFIKIIN